MSNSRTSNSIKNSISSLGTYIVITLMSLIFQSIFIKNLGSEYNGIKSLFSNILSMLSVAELGFGSAIVYHLYKPIAEQNIEEIRTLIKYYRKVYHIVAIIIFIIGICLIPFIPSIVGQVNIKENVRILFLLYLLNTVFSYLLTYKRSILYASQKTYVTNVIGIVFNILSNIIQIASILIFNNFIVYLINIIILSLTENIIINIYINKKYTYIKDLKKTYPMKKDILKDIKEKVKGLIYHKIGEFIVLGTDNIIISMTDGLGIVTVGLYTNYNMIIGRVKGMFQSLLGSYTASVGNLLIKENNEKARNIYKSMLLLNSWLFCFAIISIYCMIEPFVKIWIGQEYILSKFVLITLIVNLYIEGLRNTSNTFKSAAGIFYEDRFIPLIESVVNIVASLIFVRIFGLAGVFLGTITSTMILFLYSYPKYVYKLVLKSTYKEYFQLHIKHILITIISCIITGGISSHINVSNAWIELILNGLLCLILPNIIYFVFVMKMPEFEFYKGKLKNILMKYS